jgi:hypothetical protein
MKINTDLKLPLTQEVLKELLHYDLVTGEFIWLVSLTGSVPAYTIAGTINSHGYSVIRLNSKNYKAHNLAFLYIEGYLPESVDHIDGNPSNNSWNNLRKATLNQNQHNRKISVNNTSGVKGVWWDKARRKWHVELMTYGIKTHLGRYSTLEEATKVITLARNEMHGEFANHG